MKNAYTPYSKFRVGAAVLTSNGGLFTGCNVENTSYGMTNCVRRTAIFSAIANSGPKTEMSAMAVMNDRGILSSPCGACRQVINEFGPKAVFCPTTKGWKRAPITELLLEGFRFK
jgi:cytidine deaminase